MGNIPLHFESAMVRIALEGTATSLWSYTIKGFEHTYVTEHRVGTCFWHTEGVNVAIDAQGRAYLNLTFTQRGAKVVFFDE